MPGVPNGMGAVLFCKGDRPQFLEVFTHGDDYWESVYDGFAIEPTAYQQVAADGRVHP